jgi:aspartate carbamoyltransferase catalytic subunit
MSISYEEFRDAIHDGARRRSLLFRDGLPFFVLLSQQFSRDELEALCDTATAIRRLDRHRDGREFLLGILRGHRIMNLFAQPSTRTAQSFIAGADKLGAVSTLVSDITTSSFAKGESIADGVRTLSSFFDSIVVRHADDEFSTVAAWAMHRSQRSIPVISAGSGKSQHVTQALLDFYTLRYSFDDHGGVDGKRILIVGDIARNRAARSLALVLTKFRPAAVDFVSSEDFAPDDELLDYLRKHEIPVSVTDGLETYLRARGRDTDAIYMTRLQKEWDAGSGQPTAGAKKAELGADDSYVLKSEFRLLVRQDCVIMHPLPRINELPESWEDHPGFVVWRQVRNGMWIRAALFATIHGAAGEIQARAQRLGLI